jgi:hypothetical protein
MSNPPTTDQAAPVDFVCQSEEWLTLPGGRRVLHVAFADPRYLAAPGPLVNLADLANQQPVGGHPR